MREKTKKHIKKYKTTYSCITTGVAVATFTCIIMRGRHAENPMGSDRLDGESVRSFRDKMSKHIGRGTSVTAERGISVLADRSVVTNNVSYISSRRQGGPSWVIRCIETGKIFTSQLNAANEMNLSSSEISKHLNGIMNDVRGYHFERICIAA